MTVFDRIQILAKKKGLSVTTVATSLGFSPNLFYQWKTSTPSSERLQKVADYFGVTSEFLLTGKEESKNDEPVSFFRIDTTNLTEEEIIELQDELEEYQEFLKERIRNKRNKRMD